MYTNQIKGMHTFPEYNFAGLDWKYSIGRSIRHAPGGFKTRFLLEDLNADGVFDTTNEISLTNSTGAAQYDFQVLHDRVENFGYNVNMPYTLDDWEMEFKFGGDFISKSRSSEARRIAVSTRAFANSSDLSGGLFGSIMSNDALTSVEFSNTPIIRDLTIAGDDYVAAQKVDAYYVEADLFYQGTWRFSGGARYEDFRQAVVPFDPRTNQFDISDEADRSQLIFKEDGFIRFGGNILCQ